MYLHMTFSFWSLGGIFSFYLQISTFFESFHSIFNNKQTYAMSLGFGIGISDSHDNNDIGQDSVGDKYFATVQDKVVAISLCIGSNTLEIWSSI